MLKFQFHKDYDLSDLLKKSCQKILKILNVVACLSSCNPLWVLWNFRGLSLHPRAPQKTKEKCNFNPFPKKITKGIHGIEIW
jgi:hypothetical protein